MRILEFGDTGNDKVVLIHGLNIPWQMWNEAIDHYSQNHHVIVPALSGHDVEHDAPFVSVADEARQIREFLMQKCGNNIHMIIGMSMGAAIAFEVVSSGELHAEYLVFDSGVFVPTNPLFLSINNRAQLSYKNKTRARDEKTLKQLTEVYGEKLAPHYIAMADVMTDANLLSASRSIGHFSLPSQLQLPTTNIIAFHGTTLMEVQAKKSAKYLRKNFPKAYIKVFQGNSHGELSINHPKQFVEEIARAMQTSQMDATS